MKGISDLIINIPFSSHSLIKPSTNLVWKDQKSRFYQKINKQEQTKKKIGIHDSKLTY